MTPSPLPTDPTYSGVSVEVQGELTVDRLLTAMQDLWIYEYGHLNFKQSDGTDGDTPLWMRRFTKATGGADLHIHIGDTADQNKRLTVGFGADEANQQIVCDIRSDNNVDISTGWLNFGAATRQMLNLWNAEYGIGIQSGTSIYVPPPISAGSKAAHIATPRVIPALAATYKCVSTTRRDSISERRCARCSIYGTRNTESASNLIPLFPYGFRFLLVPRRFP